MFTYVQYLFTYFLVWYFVFLYFRASCSYAYHIINILCKVLNGRNLENILNYYTITTTTTSRCSSSYPSLLVMPTTRQGTTIDMAMAMDAGTQKKSLKRKSGNDSVPPSPSSTISKCRNSTAQHTGPATPTKRKKKVRFSDPGPQLHNTNSGSSGLTPALSRSSLIDNDVPSTSTSTSMSASRRFRRQSMPTPTTSRHHTYTYDSLSLYDRVSPPHVIQFTPFRQILDLRTQRRIRRFGLSEEINKYEREKRDDAKRKRSLEQSQDVSSILNDDSDILPVNVGPEYDNDTSSSPPMPEESYDIDSPAINGPLDDGADPQAEITDNHHHESELVALSNDLEMARVEKKEFFNACRALPCLGDMRNNDDNIFRLPSPAPDFLYQLIPILTTALTRASDTAHALDSVKQKLVNLGFQGDNIGDSVREMISQFRSARTGLENALPGENVGLEDGSATLDALVTRVKILVANVEEGHRLYDGSLGREKMLKSQFDTLLVQCDEASKRIGALEEETSALSRTLLCKTMQMEGLEHEKREQDGEVRRLSEALSGYYDESKRLGGLISDLEKESVTSRETHKRKVLELEQKCGTMEQLVSQRETRIYELEDIIQESHGTVSILTSKFEALEAEYQLAVELQEKTIAEQRENHEHEVGILNVHVSQLSTGLESARSEIMKLQHKNGRVEEQLKLEIKAKNDLMHEWIASQVRSLSWAQETVNTENRNTMVRRVSLEEPMSDDTSVSGSEPITPQNNMMRFVDVQTGRGKDRRNLDSGELIITDGEPGEFPGEDDHVGMYSLWAQALNGNGRSIPKN